MLFGEFVLLALEDFGAEKQQIHGNEENNQQDKR